jgi:hypothetical protein
MVRFQNFHDPISFIKRQYWARMYTELTEPRPEAHNCLWSISKPSSDFDMLIHCHRKNLQTSSTRNEHPLRNVFICRSCSYWNISASFHLGGISRSYSDEHKDGCLLGYRGTDDDGCSNSETSVSFYPTTRRNTPEDSHLLSIRFSNQIVYVFVSTIHATCPTHLSVSDITTLIDQQVNILTCVVLHYAFEDGLYELIDSWVI